MVDEYRRPVGRPPAGDPVITPEILEIIGREWLRGTAVEMIASAIPCDPKTVWHHINRTIRPLWRNQLDQSLVDELAKIQAIERIAWQHFDKSESVLTEQTLREAVERDIAGGIKSGESLFDGVGDGLQIVERITKKVKKLANPTWLSVIQWCIELRLKVGGHLSGAKLENEHSLRVAGMSPEQLDKKMLGRLLIEMEARGLVVAAPRREKPA